VRKLGSAMAAAVLLAAAAGSASAAASPLTGSWTSIDPVDGSTQHLSIRGSDGHVQATYVDEFGTTCVDVGAPTVVFTGVLAGTVSGNEAILSFKSAGCGSRVILRAADRFAWIFEYDPATDTLWGAINDGPAIWSRG
jgi:hypothetical protein